MSNKPQPVVSSRRRRRLSVEERRAELVALGLELFATQPYDDVWIEGVADRAGVSRGLLYHYFPTKRDYYLAVMHTAAEGIFVASTPSASAPPAQAIPRCRSRLHEAGKGGDAGPTPRRRSGPGPWLAPLARLERATRCLEGSRSIQLSYRGWEPVTRVFVLVRPGV